ncbi:GTPase IMAP family member 7 [Anabarilius grahami]|uniref:GTPase IMAP family member 7 n=1 Tax=Anabarilius grahami TaxID=495550 RepID=A0A3N0YUK2_ANAGA|nr:GTPase IMAP family member 7 [Anabarilius grahami]
MKRTMILTTDETCDPELTSEGNEFIQEITTECGGGRLQLQNTEHSQLLQKVDEIITHMCDLRIVLLGKNLSENCKVRNSILGIDVHENEVPTSIQRHNVTIVSGKLENRHVTVINTLHLLNPNISDDQITQTVRECVDMSDPGPHAFILTLQYNDFTEEDMTRVKHVLEKFSEEAIKRTIVITTDVETHNPHTLSPAEMNTAIHHLKECGGRHLQFKMENPKWQSEIFKTVDKILKENHEECLTCEIYVIASADEQIRSDYPARSEEKNKERSYHKEDRKPKERSEGNLNLVLGPDAPHDSLLTTLQRTPFEPLQSVERKDMSINIALLTALS